MNVVSRSLGQMIDQVYFDLHTPADMPLATTASVALNATDVTLTVANAAPINAQDILEIDSELVLVTAKSADATPVITISRGYYGSTAAAHSSGARVVVNPRHPRVRIGEAIKRSFPRLESMRVPLYTTVTVNRAPGLRYLTVPADARDVVSLKYLEPTTGTLVPLDAWTFWDDLPTTVSATGKAVRLASYISDDDDIMVTYQGPYRWSTHPSAPTEASTISIPEGAEDLPVLYATAWLVSRREIGRTELDRAEEWAAGEPSRGGVSAGTVRAVWQEFYRALDEARRLQPSFMPRRPYVPTPRITR